MTRTPTSFDILARKAKQGDLVATEQFLVELHGHVEIAVRARSRRLGRHGPGDDVCADLVQDLLIELWQKDLQRWDESRGAFLTFAKMRMQWQVASYTRAQSRFCDGIDVADGIASDDSDPETLLARARRERQVRALEHAIEHKLDRQARSLVKQVDLDEASLTQAARKRKMHISSACRMRQRAHAVLAAELQHLAA